METGILKPAAWDNPGRGLTVEKCDEAVGGLKFQSRLAFARASYYLILFFFFPPFIFISWRLTTLQYCSGFCHTLTWISHGFTCVPHPVHSFFNWSVVDFQCCVSFRHIAKWFHYMCVCVCVCIIFQILFPFSLLQNTEYSSMCYTVGPCCLSVLYIVVCVCHYLILKWTAINRKLKQKLVSLIEVVTATGKTPCMKMQCKRSKQEKQHNFSS